MRIRKLLNNFIVFIINGSLYYLIEYIFKTFISHSGSRTHWSMFILGGLAGLLIDQLNENISWDLSVIVQGLIGAGLITILEFCFGCVLNIYLGLGIWNYSHIPFNLLGQICLPFTIIWFFLSLVVIFLDDWLRYKLLGEEKPRYHL